MADILTVGYGSRTIDEFVELMHRYHVEVVCDVRSTPYSTRYGDFNREVFQRAMKEAGLKYLFLGDLLGARPSDPDLYVAGRASYDAMARSSMFRQGIERLEAGMDSYQISLMCAEKDPLDCHRAILIARTLQSDGVSVRHIDASGSIELQHDLEKRMLRRYGLEQKSLFDSSPDSAAMLLAYERRGSDLAYDVDAAYKARSMS